jgi:hypothetical protein
MAQNRQKMTKMLSFELSSLAGHLEDSILLPNTDSNIVTTVHSPDIGALSDFGVCGWDGSTMTTCERTINMEKLKFQIVGQGPNRRAPPERSERRPKFWAPALLFGGGFIKGKRCSKPSDCLLQTFPFAIVQLSFALSFLAGHPEDSILLWNTYNNIVTKFVSTHSLVLSDFSVYSCVDHPRWCPKSHPKGIKNHV